MNLALVLTALLSATAAIIFGIALVQRRRQSQQDRMQIQDLLHKLDASREKGANRGRRLQDLFEILPLGMVRIRRDGTVAGANARARESMEISFNPRNRPFTELFREVRLEQAIEEAVAETKERLRFPLHLGGSAKIHEVDIYPLPEETWIVIRDVTELQNLESARREFLVDVSHELRTPLTSIKIAAETLRDEETLDHGDRKRFVAIIDRHALQMEALIQDISDLSQFESEDFQLRFSALDLCNLVEEVKENLRPMADGRNVTLTITGDSHISVQADSQRLEQILNNLIANAIKFNRDPGSVEIRLTKNERDIELEVIDQGTGIAQADLPKIFHRFFRVDKARQSKDGTGLGLAIVKHLVLSHGWLIHAESELGAGSTFRVTMPD